MNWLANSHEIVASIVVGIWLAGMAFFVLGKRARDMDWLSLTVLVLFAVGIAIDLFFVEGALSHRQKIWSRGWIGPRGQDGAITLGIVEDALGLTVALCSAILGALYSLNRGVVRREPDSERALAGVLVGAAGVSVAWLSLTPWLSILGLALTTLGGILVLGANREPDLTASFGSERLWGLVLGLLGTAVLAGGRHALTLEQGISLLPSGLPRVFDWIGGSLLVSGLYLHLQPFPFFGWLSRPPRVSAAASAIGCQLFPALASFALMIRFEPELRAIGIFGFFEWLALGSAFLGAVCGLAQPGWKTTLPLWLSSALTFAFAVLCFNGPRAAFAILAGILFSGAALALLACSPEREADKGPSAGMRALVFTLLAPAMGLIGFVGAGGLLQLMLRGAENPAIATPVCLTLICCNLLLWKTGFAIAAPEPRAREPRPAQATEGHAWLFAISGWLLVAVSLGLLWTGALTGGALPGDPDMLFSSWMSEMFGATTGVAGAASAGGFAQGLYWLCIVLPALFSFWLFGRRQDRIIKALSGSPRLRGFLETGYAADRLGGWLLLGLRRSGIFLEKWISEKISSEWIPEGMARGLQAPARWISAMDRRAHDQQEKLIRKWIEVPAKTLQLVQSGDVQWYLFFTIGSIVAVLVHFLGHKA